MFIDEDEIVATYLNNVIFKITGDNSYLQKIQTKKIDFEKFTLEERNIQNEDTLILY